MDPNNQNNLDQNQTPDPSQANPAPVSPQPEVEPQPGTEPIPGPAVEVTEPAQPVEPVPEVPAPAPPADQPVGVTPVDPAPPQPAVQPEPAAQAPQPMPPAGFTGAAMPDPQPTAGPVPPAAVTPGLQPMPLGGLEQTNSKSPAKLIITIVAVVVAVAIIGGGGWYAYSHLFNKIALKTYQGDGYSVLVPKDYKQGKSSFGTGVEFKEPDSNVDTQSTEGIDIIDIPDGSRDDMIKSFDDTFSDEKSLDQFSVDGTIKDYKYTKTTVGGQDARKISAVAEKDGKKVASVDGILVFGQDKVYLVALTADAGDSSFNNAADKIISSFKLEQ